MTQENILKLIGTLLTTMIIALAGWIWSTGSSVQLLSVQKDHIKEELSRIEKVQDELKEKQETLQHDMTGTQKRRYGMERDIEYIKKGVDDIKESVQGLKK